MRIDRLFTTVLVSALLVWACDSGESSGDGAAGGAALPAPTGGAGAPAAPSGVSGAPSVSAAGAPAGVAGAHPVAAGGSAAAAGSGSVVGAAGAPVASDVRLGTGGPFAFPQNKKPGSCSLTTTANAAAAVQSAYSSWKSAFVTSNGAGTGLRVQRNSDGNDTVSEGIGYGMIAAVYMSDRPTFDGLWAYAKGHFDSLGLMDWHISAGGALMGMGSATDGDEDMAWALLMASDQWSSATYLADAKTLINNMYSTEIAPDGTLKPGDNWGGTSTTFPDYFSPAYFRVFAKATNNPNWSGVIINRNYEILDKVQGGHGLVPDKTTNSGYETSANYSYDACRTPWRIGMDFCFNAEPRAQAYLMKVGTFFNGVGAGNIVDGYANSGSQTGGAKNMAFIGPAGVAGMMGFQTLLDGAFAYGASNQGDSSYYPQSLRVLTMLMMSGNFVDFSKP